MPKTEISDIAHLESLTGHEVAISDWLEITQDRINAFAEATNDFQWIHVDPARCLRESPFKTTIAHGYLTLSLISQFSYASIGIKQKFAMTINYGCNRVRFISPVLCGAKLRARYQLLEVTQFEGGYQSRWQVTIEMEGNTKPACVAETISRYYNEGPK